MSMEDSFKCLTAVAGEMKTVCHLDSVRSSPTGPVGVVTRAITANEFRRLVLAKPVTQTIGHAIWQKVHHFAGGNVYQHGAKPVAAAQREIIDTQNHWRIRNRHRKRSDEPYQSHAVHGDGAALGKPRAGAAANG
jgi:hypothetical protein